jgi:excisionase family DNA binding protein
MLSEIVSDGLRISPSRKSPGVRAASRRPTLPGYHSEEE